MRRSRRYSTVLTFAVAATVPISLLVGSAVGPEPARAETAAEASAETSAVADAQWAPDEASAQTIAQQYGHPVAVDSEASPTQLVSALPDGSMQLESDAVPQRVMQGTSWVPVDTTLQVDSDGMFAPKASAAPVEFSVGGTDLIDRVQTSSGAWVSETWPYGALPSAVVEGSSVTYPGVLPGVDLRLTAAPGGMSEVLVVADAQAAANPQLTSLHLGVPDASVSVNALAQVKAVVPDGSSAQAAAPTWWDSSDVNAGPGGPGGDESPRPLGDASTGSGLTLNIGSALSGASPVFPVFIDPEWTPSGSPYWFTDAAYPDQSYLNGNYADGIQAVGNGGGYKSDAFWQFSLTKVEHTHITKAVMNTTQLQTGNCSPTSISVAVFGPHTAGFTWNQEWDNWGSAAWGAYLQTQDPNYGCPGVAAHSVGWTVTSAIVAKAAAGSSYIQLGLEPRYRTDDNSRRHYAQAASLTIDYNSYPGTPTSTVVSTPSRGCGTLADPAYVNNKAQSIVLSAIVTDPDGQNTAANFYLSHASDSTVIANPSSGFGAQSLAKKTTTNFAASLPEGAYKWWARGSDNVDNSVASTTPCYLTVDDTAPPLPAVSYTGSAPVVGQPMTVTIDDSSDLVWTYAYWWTIGDQAGPIPTTMNTSAPWNMALPAVGGVRYAIPGSDQNQTTVTVAPIDTVATLWVAAYDKAGNVSLGSDGTPAARALSVQAAADPGVSYSTGHGWITSSSSGNPTAVPDANTTAGSVISSRDDLTLAPTTSLDPSGSNGAALSFPGTQTVATHTGRQDLDTTKSFTVSAWLSPGAVTDSGIYTAVSESGSVNSGFYLQVNQKRWSFCVRQQSPSAAAVCAMTDTIVQPGVPVFVTGIWDAVNQQVRLLLGSSISAQTVTAHAPVAGDVAAAGPTVVGSAVSNSSLADPWLGEITDPTLFQAVVDSGQLANLNQQYPPQ